MYSTEVIAMVPCILDTRALLVLLLLTCNESWVAKCHTSYPVHICNYTSTNNKTKTVEETHLIQ